MLVHYGGGGGGVSQAAVDASIAAAIAGMVPVTLRSALGATSGPNTVSAADPMTAVVPEMTITANFGGKPILVLFSGHFTHSALGVNVDVELYDEATRIAETRRLGAPVANGGSVPVAFAHLYTPAAGARTIDVRWRTPSGTLTAGTTRRQLIIVQFG